MPPLRKSVSVVVGDLDTFRSGMRPGEAVVPLINNADAVLTLAISAEPFEAIAGRNPQIINGLRRIQNQKLAIRDPLQLRTEFAYMFPLPDPLAIRVHE